MAKTGHPNFVYKVSSPWRVGRHTWSITGNHSGSSLDSGDAETFMLGTASPFYLSYAPFLSADTSGGTGYVDYFHQVVGVAYYDGQNSAPVFEEDFNSGNPAPSNLFPTGTGYNTGSPDSQLWTNLEACAVLQARIGVSKTNKPVLVRKFLHGLPNNACSVNIATGVSVNVSTAGTTAMENQSNGAWFGSRVYIARSGNQPSASAWEVIAGNRQMPRGRRKVSAKAATAGNESLLQLIESGAISTAITLGVESLL